MVRDGVDQSKFLPATPVPGALLVNTGRALEEFSQGFYRATCHAVVRRSEATRVSLVFFYDAGDRSRTEGGC